MTVPDYITLTELIDLDKLQEMQDAFASATNVASVITDTDGNAITKPSNFSRLCSDIIRKTEIGCSNCVKSDATIGKVNKFGPTIQPCLSCGLWDGGASICVGDRHIANWLIGQVRNEETPTEKIMEYASQIGVDAEVFREALLEVPVMPTEQFSRLCYALFLLANNLSDIAYKNYESRINEERLKKVNNKLRSICIATVGALASSIEAKDAYTKGHCERVTAYCVEMAKTLGLDEYEVCDLEFAAMLHDIGKIGVPDEVLNDGSRFDVNTCEPLINHPRVGHDILVGVEFLENSRKIILQHHERPDGTGYPVGLRGKDIMLSARILAVADAFDAMTSQRAYRVSPLSLEEAFAELRKYAGTHFDKQVVEAAIKVLKF